MKKTSSSGMYNNCVIYNNNCYSGRHFPEFGLSPNAAKYGPE